MKPVLRLPVPPPGVHRRGALARRTAAGRPAARARLDRRRPARPVPRAKGRSAATWRTSSGARATRGSTSSPSARSCRRRTRGTAVEHVGAAGRPRLGAASASWKSLTSSWTSRRPFHSLIDGWKATRAERARPSASLPRSAMFQAIALTIDVALGEPELEVVLPLADEPGLADDPDPAGQQQRAGGCRCRRARATRSPRRPGASACRAGPRRRSMSTFCSCSGVRAARQWSSNRSAKSAKWPPGSFRPAAAAWPPKPIRPSEQALDRLVEVEARDRPGRALAELVAEGDDDRPAGGRSRPAGWRRCR